MCGGAYLAGLGGGAEEDGPAVREEAEAGEEPVDLGAGLVHGGDDGHALAPRQARDAADHVVGGGAVEPAGGLVQEQQRGAGEDLHADAHPPPLPAADALVHPPADARVRRALQPHLPQRLLRALPLGGRRHRGGQLQLRRVVHRLAHRQRRHQHVVLRHVRLRGPHAMRVSVGVRVRTRSRMAAWVMDRSMPMPGSRKTIEISRMATRGERMGSCARLPMSRRLASVSCH
jgi:hypothetical protein